MEVEELREKLAAAKDANESTKAELESKQMELETKQSVFSDLEQRQAQSKGKLEAFL